MRELDRNGNNVIKSSNGESNGVLLTLNKDSTEITRA